MKNGQLYKVTHISPWAHQMVFKYGNIATVGDVGDRNVMFCNIGCDNIENGSFHWGYWLSYAEATFTLVDNDDEPVRDDL
jgi:hypothetical protein